MEGFFFIYYNMNVCTSCIKMINPVDPVDLEIKQAMDSFISRWMYEQDSKQTRQFILKQFRDIVVKNGYTWEEFAQYIHATYETGFEDLLYESMQSVKTPEEWFNYMEGDIHIIVYECLREGKDPVLAITDALEDYIHGHSDDQTEVIMI